MDKNLKTSHSDSDSDNVEKTKTKKIHAMCEIEFYVILYYFGIYQSKFSN